ncbi:hypothetical protein [Formosa maritima]|uniref:Uncharacterized protein n=1 Tax=Formosa maritima TaxID=2592046 RepID=A0A5D0GI57_9FLAO|nr:hypothetical protein [Formosa maritima]TYA58019.1 hypothetical protein FVF61_04195 [Formosa maritima]
MKKTLSTIIFALVCTSIFWNCKQETSLSETEFEQIVFYEMFPTILDSIYYDNRLMPPPPPPEFFENYNNNRDNDYTKAIEEWKKTNEYKKGIYDWELKKDSIQRDSTFVYLIVQDSLTQYEENDKSELIKHFALKSMEVDSLNLSTGFKIDLSKLKPNNKIVKFKYQSKFPKGRKFWQSKYDFNIIASIGFSRILFDKTKKFGVINAGYTMAPLNGYGVRIFIKKSIEGKWVIDKIINTWIS